MPIIINHVQAAADVQIIILYLKKQIKKKMFKSPKEFTTRKHPLGWRNMNTHSQYPFRSTGHSDDGNCTGEHFNCFFPTCWPKAYSYANATHTQLKQDPNAYRLNMQVVREGTLLLISKGHLRHCRLLSKDKGECLIPTYILLPV